ncbi:MAG: valine--tRNA ligase [Candidatus Diapherotrites archaeon]|nr:valine--tRNA ligase [Candidatus Diapherotrites archaeon]
MLDKRYEPEKVEKKWQEFWEREQVYAFKPDSQKKPFVIDTPPPYASAGHLHVGHALHYTQFEIIARQRRMAGYNVYFPPCFDDNGLPTEKYVEEKLGVSKKNINRAEFRKLCLKESTKVEDEYAEKVFKRLGHSYDWNLLYTTISKEAQRVSQTSFLRLLKSGECYRAEEPVLWCPHHQTALAQAEVEDVHRTTELHYILFDLEGGEQVEIATTRPELLPACVGIFVHPDDKRYKKLVGKKARVPLFGQLVPIMADEKVEKDFGTGIVMICTFGDKTDIEWWKEHKLPLKIAITKDGKMNELAGKYAGMSLKEARAAILEELDGEDRVTKKEQIEQEVGTCWRCGTPVEFIVTKQFFIKTLAHKDALIKQAEKINWYPSFYRKRFEDWTRNLKWDWCISRQRYYGVPIPVWYCKHCGEMILPDEKDLPLDPMETKPNRKCPKCGSTEFVPEEDVFDTWMTSSMSPEIAIRWLEKPEQFKKLFPVSLRPQAQDIIRTWAFYTILKAYLHFNEIPWKDIALGTFVLDPKGKGMSKSKGNVVWADELLKRYDVDTFRYWVGTAKWGSDIPFREADLVAGKKFLTKLWNASRFALMHLQDYKPGKRPELELMDKWLLSKLNEVVKTATERFEAYDTSEAKEATELFFWRDFCDNYLEIVKDRLYNPEERGNKARLSAQYTLYTALLTILKLMAPIIPHITEEIYQSHFKEYENAKSIHVSKWPKCDDDCVNEEAEKVGELMVGIVSEVRKFKTENQLSLKTPVKLTLPKEQIEALKPVMEDFKAVTKATEIKEGKFSISSG